MSLLGFLLLWKCTPSKATWGGKDSFAYASTSQSIIRETQDRYSRQDTKQRPWKNAVIGLHLLNCLACFYYASQDRLPRGGAAHRGLGTPTSISVKKMAHRYAHRQPDGVSLSIEVLFPDVPRLCQIDRKPLTSTNGMRARQMSPRQTLNPVGPYLVSGADVVSCSPYGLFSG